LIEIPGGVNLQGFSIFQYYSPIGNGKHIFGIVGDKNGGGAGLPEDVTDLTTYLVFEYCINVTERFIKKDEAGIWGKRAGKCNTLALPSG
jgi:hypothetical protein